MNLKGQREQQEKGKRKEEGRREKRKEGGKGKRKTSYVHLLKYLHIQ